jgi:hypothetical protein
LRIISCVCGHFSSSGSAATCSAGADERGKATGVDKKNGLPATWRLWRRGGGGDVHHPAPLNHAALQKEARKTSSYQQTQPTAKLVFTYWQKSRSATNLKSRLELVE